MPLKLLKDLNDRINNLNFKEVAKNAEHVLERCENVYNIFLGIKEDLEKLIPTIEQLRGMCKGIQLSMVDIEQHKAILKQACKEEKFTKEEYWERVRLIDNCIKTLEDTHSVRKDEFLKVVGKAEGIYTSAKALVDQIELYLNNLKRQERIIEESPELFELDETAKNDNSVEKSVENVASISSIKPMKKKKSSKKAAVEKN